VKHFALGAFKKRQHLKVYSSNTLRRCNLGSERKCAPPPPQINGYLEQRNKKTEQHQAHFEIACINLNTLSVFKQTEEIV
jgi:hypothetical protein